MSSETVDWCYRLSFSIFGFPSSFVFSISCSLAVIYVFISSLLFHKFDLLTGSYNSSFNITLLYCTSLVKARNLRQKCLTIIVGLNTSNILRVVIYSKNLSNKELYKISV